MVRYLPFLLVLAVWIYAFIDCLNTPEDEVRKLPKVVWVIIILLFGQVLLGPIAWFAAGRPRRNAPYGATRPDERRWVAPDDNPDFLKSLQGDSGTGDTPGTQAVRDADEPRTADDKDDTVPADAEVLQEREADLPRREDEIRRNDNEGGADDTPPTN